MGLFNDAGPRSAKLLGQLYSYAGLRISSAFPLSELLCGRSARPQSADVAFCLLAVAPSEPVASEWIHHWRTEGGALSLSIARCGAGFLVRFPHLADFVVSADGGEVGAWPAPGTTPETLRHLLLDQVLPRVLAHGGRLVLHAAAVRVGGRSVAFVGETGSGKSTLAASLHEAGYSLLSDDGLLLGVGEGCALALPTYTSLRLWPRALTGLFVDKPALAPVAHYSFKRRVVLEGTASTYLTPVPLAALYVLAPEAEARATSISLTRLAPRDCCMAIIGNAFRLDLTDRVQMARLLVSASDIARHVPAFSLTFPRDFARLPDVRSAILQQRGLWAGSRCDGPRVESAAPP